MSRILITGGSGFIGTNLVAHFRARGSTVLNLDIAPPRNAEHGPVWRNVSILDRAELARLVADFNPNVVYHMAARTDLVGKTIGDYAENTQGVAYLIEAVRQLPSLRFLAFGSSMLVCRAGYVPKHETDYCPNTHYGASKVQGEQIVRDHASGSIPWTIVRPTSIWGPWFGTPYREFFEAVRRGVYMHPKGLRVRRSFGFVLNTVLQLDRLAHAGSPLVGKTIYLADYEPIELKRWAVAIQGNLGTRPVREVPLWVLRAAALCGDALKWLGYKVPPITSARLRNLLTEVIHDTSPLQSVCSNIPYSMEEGVRITCEWLRQHPI